MSVDILGTSWDQCRSMVQYSFTSTETRRLVRTDSQGRPPRLSHSSWTPPTSCKEPLVVCPYCFPDRYPRHHPRTLESVHRGIIQSASQILLRFLDWKPYACVQSDRDTLDLQASPSAKWQLCFHMPDGDNDLCITIAYTCKSRRFLCFHLPRTRIYSINFKVFQT